MNKAFGTILLISLVVIAIVMTWAMIEFQGQNESIAIAFGAATAGTGMLDILSGSILLLIGIQKKTLRVYAYASFILAVILLLCGLWVIWYIVAHH